MSVPAALGNSLDGKAPPPLPLFLFMTDIKDFPRKFSPYFSSAWGVSQG